MRKLDIIIMVLAYGISIFTMIQGEVNEALLWYIIGHLYSNDLKLKKYYNE